MISILRLQLDISETSSPYNQFSLAWADQHQITLCTYFRPIIDVASGLEVFSGDATLVGFRRALKAALATQPYDVIHAHSPHVGALFILLNLWRPWLFRSTVYTVHTSYPNYKLRNKLLTVIVFLFFHRIVFCSKSSHESFPRFFRWMVRHRSHVISNGVDIERVDRASQPTLTQESSERLMLVVIGRFVPSKNFMTILDAFRQSDYDTNQLVFIGDGPLRGEIEAHIKTSGLAEHVAITGMLPRDDVYRYLVQADLFISASEIEGMPVSVLEAMLARCPVILSDIPPHRELVHGLDEISLIDPSDASALARELKRFLQMPAADRLAIGERNRQHVVTHYSLTQMHQAYERVYAEVNRTK